MIFFVILMLLPLVEITLFIIVGGALGVFPTLLLCLLSLLAGGTLLQARGLQALASVPRTMDSALPPPLFDAACFTLAGILLVIPGFFTDALALCLLVPALRQMLQRRLERYFGIDPATADALVIEAEYERLDDKESP